MVESYALLLYMAMGHKMNRAVIWLSLLNPGEGHGDMAGIYALLVRE